MSTIWSEEKIDLQWEEDSKEIDVLFGAKLLDLDYLHQRAQEVFDRFGEEAERRTLQDSLFCAVLDQIQRHGNPASLPLLLLLCDDARFEVSLFQESWLNVFAFGFETEDLCRELFLHLHELFPHAKMMAMNIFLYSIGVNFFPLKHRGIDVIELQKRYVLLADPVSFKYLIDTSRTFYRQELFGGDLVEESVQYVESVLSELGSYYDQHRIRLVE
jgi:hypothetical protein